MPQIAPLLGAVGGTALGSAAAGTAATAGTATAAGTAGSGLIGALGLGAGSTGATALGTALPAAGGMLGYSLMGGGKQQQPMMPLSTPTPVTQALPSHRLPVQISPNYGLTRSKPDSALEEAIRQLLMRG